MSAIDVSKSIPFKEFDILELLIKIEEQSVHEIILFVKYEKEQLIMLKDEICFNKIPIYILVFTLRIIVFSKVRDDKNKLMKF